LPKAELALKTHPLSPHSMLVIVKHFARSEKQFSNSNIDWGAGGCKLNTFFILAKIFVTDCLKIGKMKKRR